MYTAGNSLCIYARVRGGVIPPTVVDIRLMIFNIELDLSLLDSCSEDCASERAILYRQARTSQNKKAHTPEDYLPITLQRHFLIEVPITFFTPTQHLRMPSKTTANTPRTANPRNSRGPCAPPSRCTSLGWDQISSTTRSTTNHVPLSELLLTNNGRRYRIKKSNLFAHISWLLGLAPPPVGPHDVIKAANEPAIVYSAHCLWEFTTGHPYFPSFYVLWVLTMLSTSVPYIYNSLAECEKSAWLIMGTDSRIICDVSDGCQSRTDQEPTSTICATNHAHCQICKKSRQSRQPASQCWSTRRVRQRRHVGVCRFLAVLKSQAKWKIRVVVRSDGNWLSKEEELLVMG